MANLEMTLEEQLSDLRSDQIAYKLVVRNVGASPVRLLSINPRVPIGAELVEITDRSLAEASERRVELLEDLNKLLKQFLWVESEAFRRAWIDKQQETFKKVLSFSGFAKLYYELAKVGPKEWIARMEREFAVLGFKIATAKDARDAINRWITDAHSDLIVASLISAKTDQLEEIESLMNDADKSSLATIEPAAEFTSTYVLRFDRARFEPKKYQVGFDATYSEPERERAQVGSAATNVQISPYPLSLSMVAIGAALLGTLLRITTVSNDFTFGAILTQLQASATGFVIGPILALIFFNVYEHTSLGSKMRLPVSWRSALLIGALCGLAHENFLAALKALVGA